MFGELKEILSKLNSASDWAVVGAAAVVGFSFDAAINIVPLPVFSPGVCGATAAGSALSAKRGWEAWRERSRMGQILTAYKKYGDELHKELTGRGLGVEARALLFQIELAEINHDTAALQQALTEARKLL
jgi:hypothetical protein